MSSMCNASKCLPADVVSCGQGLARKGRVDEKKDGEVCEQNSERGAFISRLMPWHPFVSPLKVTGARWEVESEVMLK